MITDTMRQRTVELDIAAHAKLIELPAMSNFDQLFYMGWRITVAPFQEGWRSRWKRPSGPDCFWHVSLDRDDALRYAMAGIERIEVRIVMMAETRAMLRPNLGGSRHRRPGHGSSD